MDRTDNQVLKRAENPSFFPPINHAHPQVMGQNFALNMASHGFSVSVCNRSPGKVDATVERAKEEGDLPLVGYKEPKEFIESLAKPRKVILLVQAGAAVDATIATLSEFMEEGDILVDCGNEWFPNSQRRAKELEPKKIMFVGMGISGGEEGARNGPSLMPGGPKEAFDALAPIITKCAAQVRKCTGCNISPPPPAVCTTCTAPTCCENVDLL